ncbi:hypothetical protein EJ08DRAFT_645870 [Tothia fuscella]|uniref:DNA helicase n=1 Tax=Tothia fuscella TaxID=1048955 RepID=A0A9P4U440_9PEZI|nr:hypothetical protein EJ08DRAFT_645870 [Tothia fuscella]
MQPAEDVVVQGQQRDNDNDKHQTVIDDTPTTHDNQRNESHDKNGLHAEVTAVKTEDNDNDNDNAEAKSSAEEQSGAEVGNNKKRKRKIDSINKSSLSSRAPSPPWKKIHVEGPTSFIVDGKRKSSRVNTLPHEMQPATPTTPTTSSSEPQRKTRGASNSSKPRPSYAALHNGTAADVKPKAPASKEKKPPSSSANSPAQPQFRKPGRPRKNPLELQSHKRSSSNSMPSPATEKKSPPKSSRGYSRNAQNDLPSTPGRRKLGANGFHGAEASKTTSPRSQRLKIRVRDPSATVLQPPLPSLLKKHASFAEFLQNDNPLEGETDIAITPAQALQEARIRIKLAKAAEPGGFLSREKCARFMDVERDEPPPRYGHWSYLSAHAINFHKLLTREKLAHRKQAKHVAVQCQSAIQSQQRWAFCRQPKSEEEAWIEQRENQALRAKQVVKDLIAKWEMVRQEVHKLRFAKWQEDQELLGKQALDDMLDKSNLLLNQGRNRDSSEFPSEFAGRSSIDPFGSDAGTGADRSDAGSGNSDAADSDDENMSESEDEEDAVEAQDEDAHLSPNALKAKYVALMEQRLPSDSSEDSEESEQNEDQSDAEDVETPTTTLDTLTKDSADDDVASTKDPTEELAPEGGKNDAPEETPPPIEEVDDFLLDDSDEESTEMDSGTEDDAGEELESEEEEEDEGDLGNSLLGFYGKDLIKTEPEEVDDAVSGAEAKAPDQEQEAVDPEMEDVEEIERPKTIGIRRPDLSIDKSVARRSASDSIPSTPKTPKTPSRTEVPSILLRGTLREYQHDGLDWLANLYTGNRNGILADEMGLGKTIQTISLLAHLAVKHEIWGPHLIVVPSSVILNWEIEFKKFLPGFKILTYYGTQSDRKGKREGWLNDDKWNVVITSYQLILKDHQAFKRRNWHYLVLDEAHNIKNFKSKRWQVMLSFKTHSRLLLTGTPLQNNLQELWSLLYFLMPAGLDGLGGFADLEKFLSSMKRPADQILDQGRQKLDEEAQSRVTKLHEVLRPFLLRRLKAEVEKQMPGKYEHVVYCRLSKRQRQLYDEFMGRSDTKRTLSSGNYMSIINCLMSLRKVCNHPDLFETRQIVTSFAMPKSVVADFEIKELLVRRCHFARDRDDDAFLDFAGLVPTVNEIHSRLHSIRRDYLKPTKVLYDLVAQQSRRLKASTDSGLSTTQSVLGKIASDAQLSVLDQLKNCAAHARRTADRWPIYGTDLVKLLTMPNRFRTLPPNRRQQHNGSMGEWYLNNSSVIPQMMPTLEEQAARSEILVTKFGCLTPAVVAEDVLPLVLTRRGIDIVQQAQQLTTSRQDPYHEARIRLSIAFPDKRLLQYDCGKLQRLDKLLRQLQAGGHRCLIFTQMTKVLDILEQFLNIHGHRYLRLDGGTKIEQRQILTDRFNEDKSILAFILSSRSGGLGINLTGADTVIFYDLDWNPAMDAQCQDRCHRIGQTRDVHIYRFVSEYTIEANILRKSNQKRLLDDVIIQKGEFTTDYFNKISYKDAFEDTNELQGEDAEASAAMDRVLGEVTGLGRVLESVEDKEDAVAAKVAQKEMVEEVDAADFSEVPVASTLGTEETPLESGVSTLGVRAANGLMEDDEVKPHVDDYMVRTVLDWYKYIPYVPKNAARKKSKKGRDYRR